MEAPVIRALFDAIAPNPDLVGQVKVMKEDVEPAKLDAYDQKLRRARAYLEERNLKPRPICRTLNTED